MRLSVCSRYIVEFDMGIKLNKSLNDLSNVFSFYITI